MQISTDRHTVSARRLWLLALSVLAANLIASVVWPHEHTGVFGGFRFPARSPYKPLLLLNGAFVLYLVFSRGRTAAAALPELKQRARSLTNLEFPFTLLVACVVIAAYFPAIGVNFSHHDWTHRHIGAGLNSWPAVWRLFTVPQPDGMYRPLAFLSFWLDYRLFGDKLWGYHLQSIGLHLVNSLLVGMLGTRLGFPINTSRVAALVFGVSAIHFEAVLWPAARFDLLAATFGALSLLFFFAHWESWGARARWYGFLSLLSYVLGVLNKETAYSVVLLVPALVVVYPRWRPKSAPKRRAIPFLIALLCCTITLVAIRFVVFGNLGGYGWAGPQSGNSTVSLKSFYSLIVNSLSLSMFGINTTLMPAVAGLITVAYLCVLVLWAVFYAGPRSRANSALAVFTLLSAVPAISVIGWIQPSLQHSRHLYWPSIWIAILFAFALQRTSGRSIMTGAFLAVQVAGLSYNLWVYRDLFSRADLCSVQAREAVFSSRYAQQAEIQLIGVPDDPNGVFYFRTELEEDIRKRIPGATVRFCPRLESCASGPDQLVVRLRWDAGSRSLHLVAP